MTIQSAKALYSKLIADEQFKKQLEQAASDEKLRQVLKMAGFACTLTNLNIGRNQLL